MNSPRLVTPGCSTSTNRHYVFPRGAGDLLTVEVEAAERVGLRFHLCCDSMDVGHAGIADPLAALVLGPARRVERLLVNGRTVVENGELKTADEVEIAREIAVASRQLAEKAEEAAL